MAIKWQVDCVNIWTRDGKQDVVDSVHYTVSFEGGETQARRQGLIGVPYDPNATIKPLQDLSEPEMVQWVQDAINASTPVDAPMSNVEALEFQLTREATIRTVTPKAVQDRLDTEVVAVAIG